MAWVRRIFRWITTPAAIGVTALVAGVVTLTGWGIFETVLDKTNTLEFCISCHSMESTVYQEYKKSPHYMNASGVRAVCADCHVPKALPHKLVAKAMAVKDVWHTILGTIDTPEKFEKHRLTLAKGVWAKMVATDSRECRSCHKQDAMDIHKQSPKAQNLMQKGLLKGETCISCHKGIAHKLPDMSGGYRTILADLKDAAANKSGNADTLYTIETAPFYRELPQSADDKDDGNIFPFTMAKVVERKGDFVKVAIGGWVQEGMERLLVTAKGRRIFEVALSPQAAEAVQRSEPVVDADTGLTWQQGSVTGWVTKTALTADLKALNGYGAEIASAACGACHTQPLPEHFMANQWIGVVKDMKGGTALSAEEVRVLVAYFQTHAKDMTKAEH